MKSGLIGCLLVAFVVSGCSGHATVRTPPEAVQRDVAGHFASAVLRGDTAGARALLVPTRDGALAALVQWAAAPWRTHHAAIRLPARRVGDRWTFSYAGERPQGGGRFEKQSGDLVVVVASSRAGAGVQSFILSHVRTLFSTHHDAVLQPSKR